MVDWDVDPQNGPWLWETQAGVEKGPLGERSRSVPIVELLLLPGKVE